MLGPRVWCAAKSFGNFGTGVVGLAITFQVSVGAKLL